MASSDFTILVCRGDERPPAADVEAADLVLKVTPRGRVSVLSAPGLLDGTKVKIVNPNHDRSTA